MSEAESKKVELVPVGEVPAKIDAQEGKNTVDTSENQPQSGPPKALVPSYPEEHWRTHSVLDSRDSAQEAEDEVDGLIAGETEKKAPGRNSNSYGLCQPIADLFQFVYRNIVNRLLIVYDYFSDFLSDHGPQWYKFLFETRSQNPVLNILQCIFQCIFGCIFGVYSYVLSFFADIPKDSIIHIVTFVFVVAGVVTLFVSPMFRSKLDEMRQRPPSMQNGVIDAMASDYFNVLKDETAPKTKQKCQDMYFRCQYYWADDTDDTKNTFHTPYCRAYVCAGMTVKLNVLPETCSGSNRLAIAAMMKDIYSKPVYSCGNSGCGECSSVRYTTLEDGLVSFLQGCHDDASCYGQIEVSATWEPQVVSANSLKQPKGKGPWSKFRGGPYNQGVIHVSGPGRGSKPLPKWDFSAGSGFRSSPAISSAGTVYVGSDDKHLYALLGKNMGKDTAGTVLWAFTTGGKVSSSPALSADESHVFVGSEDGTLYSIDTVTGKLAWKFETGAELSSSPVASIADGGVTVVYIGGRDGSLYAIQGEGVLKWRFSTVNDKAVIPSGVVVSNSGAAAAAAQKSSRALLGTTSSNTGSGSSSSSGGSSGSGSSSTSSKGSSGSSGSSGSGSTSNSPLKGSSSSSGSSSPASKGSSSSSSSSSSAGSSSTAKPDSTSNSNSNSKAAESSSSSTSTTDLIGKPLRAGGGAVYSSPALSADGLTLFFGSDSGTVYSVSHAGHLNWKFKTHGAIYASPTISSDGLTVYVGSDDQHLYAFTTSGALKWRFYAERPIRSAVAVFGSSIFLATATSPIIPVVPPSSSSAATTAPKEVVNVFKSDTKTGFLIAVSNYGENQWKLSLPEGSSSSPLVDEDGMIYIGANDTRLYVVRPTGEVKWNFKTTGKIIGTPGFDKDGTLIVPTWLYSKDNKDAGGKLHVLSPSLIASDKSPTAAPTPLPAPMTAWVCNADSLKAPSTSDVCSDLDGSSKSASASAFIDGNSKRDRQRRGRRMLREEKRRGGVPVRKLATDSVSSQSSKKANSGSFKSSSSDGSDSISSPSSKDSAKGSSSSSSSKETTTASKAKKAKAVCLPGLSHFIGRGVDITYHRDDPKFVKTRVFEFSDFSKKINLHGTDYIAPQAKELFVDIVDEQAAADTSISAMYSGVNSYTLTQAARLKVIGQLPDFSVERMSVLSAISIYANATFARSSIAASKPVSSYFWSADAEETYSLAATISNNAEKEKQTFVNVATVTKAHYTIPPQDKGHLCSRGFYDKIRYLPVVYDTDTYRGIIEQYGTHIIVGASLGGSITTAMAYDPCSALDEYSTNEEAFADYMEEVGDFTAFLREPSMVFLGQNISRIHMSVCGGKASAYVEAGEESYNAWNYWTKTVLKEKGKPCVLQFSVIPIYATVPPTSIAREHLASAMFEYMNSAKASVSYNMTETTRCRSKKAISSSSISSSSSSSSVGAPTNKKSLLRS